MRKLKICLLSILLTSQTAFTQSEIKLDLGVRAPYSGILIPVDNYKFYQEQRLQNEELKKLALEPVDKENHSLELFFGGLALGVIVAIAFASK